MNVFLPLTALAAGLSLWLTATRAPREVAWLDDLAQAELAARKNGKPLLAVFR